MSESIVLPDPVPYSRFFKFEDRPELKGLYAYVVKDYSDTNGFMFIVSRASGVLTIQVADFNGNILDPKKVSLLSKSISMVTEKWITRIIDLIKLIGIKQAIFYFSVTDIPRLVDIRLSLNKMCGPGYIQDFFNKAGIPTQEIIDKPLTLTDENIRKIRNLPDERYIIKPSVFKSIIQGKDLIPLYGVISHEIKHNK